MVENTIKAFSARKHCAYVMASAGAGETTSGCVYSGRNYIAENGKILQKTAPFSNNAAMIEIDVGFLAFEKRKKRNGQTVPGNVNGQTEGGTQA